MYDQLENSAFDNFDPDNFDLDALDSFDPDNATGKKVASARPGAKMQINLTIYNPTTEKLTVELFSALDSVTSRLKSELVKGNYAMKPLTSLEGIIAAAAAGQPGIVGFDAAGDLVIHGNSGDAVAKVTCNEYPYKSLFENSKHSPFVVSKLRVSCQTDLQISNNITHFQKTMGGGVKENTISVRAHFNPTQYQGRIIDINQSFTISGEKGLLYPINAGETVELALFIQKWTKQSI
jgi:hypothetical protein